MASINRNYFPFNHNVNENNNSAKRIFKDTIVAVAVSCFAVLISLTCEESLPEVSVVCDFIPVIATIVWVWRRLYGLPQNRTNHSSRIFRFPDFSFPWHRTSPKPSNSRNWNWWGNWRQTPNSRSTYWKPTFTPPSNSQNRGTFWEWGNWRQTPNSRSNASGPTFTSPQNSQNRSTFGGNGNWRSTPNSRSNSGTSWYSSSNNSNYRHSGPPGGPSFGSSSMPNGMRSTPSKR